MKGLLHRDMQHNHKANEWINKIKVFIIKGETGRAPRRTEFHSGPFLQSNISILIAGNPVRSDNAWNEDHSENVYAQWRIVKLQAWDSVISIYCLHHAAVVCSPGLNNTEVDAIAIASSVFCVLAEVVPLVALCAMFIYHLVEAFSHFFTF